MSSPLARSGSWTEGRAPRRLGAALLVALALPGAAPGQLARQEKATLAVEPARASFAAGGEAELLITMEIESGWHTNSHEPTYDYLIATEVAVEAPDGWEPARVTYPPGELKTFAFTEEEPISVFEGTVVMVARQPIPPDAPNGPVELETRLTYQACDDRSCLPPVTTSARLELTIGEEGELSPAATELQQATGRQDGTASQRWTGRRDGTGPSLAWMLLLGVLGGLILNAMPCVLPVLSLKVFGLVRSAGQGRAEVVRGTLATAAGILASFWALALLAVAARAGGKAVGWGIQFQEPTFVAALTVIVVLFCLNLWGVFEITLPGGLANATGASPRGGLAGHFTSGLFATLMATPCSAPFLGTAIGFGLSQSAGTILAVFTAVGLGMAVPYLALAAAPGAARLLPRPGPWMGHLRVFMGFLLAGAAVWLLWVLAAQISPERLAFFELALLAMALLVWWRQAVLRQPRARAAGLVAVVASIALALLLARQVEPLAADAALPAAGLIEWSVFDRAAAERLTGEGRLVFVDVTADWCFTCKVNERLVLETGEVAGVFARHGVVAMKADWTNRSDPIAAFLADHGRYGIPFYLLYRPHDEPHLFGELITKQEIVRVVEEAGGGLAAQRASGD